MLKQGVPLSIRRPRFTLATEQCWLVPTEPIARRLMRNNLLKKKSQQLRRPPARSKGSDRWLSHTATL